MDKLNDFDFHRTQIGYITECVEPISGIITVRDSIGYFENDPELQALPVELEQGYGVLSRDDLEQDKIGFRNASKPVSSLNLHQGNYESINSRENIRKLFLQIAGGELEELKYYVVYHNNNLFGVVSLHNIIRHISDIQNWEVKQARKMQQKVLERNLIEDSSFRIQADIRLSHDLGGDYYYSAHISENLSMISCFDVNADHITASMISVMIDAYFKTRNYLHELEKEDVEKLILGLNSLLLEEIPQDSSVSGLFLFIRKNESKVYAYNFGYTAPFFILSEEGKIRAKKVSAQYRPLGVEDIVIFRDAPQVYEMDNLKSIFIYSDGAEDCLNPFGEKFGMERIKNCLVKNFKKLGDGFSSILYDELDQFRHSAPLVDDITTLVVLFR